MSRLANLFYNLKPRKGFVAMFVTESLTLNRWLFERRGPRYSPPTTPPFFARRNKNDGGGSSSSIPPPLISSHNPSSTCVSWIKCTRISPMMPSTVDGITANAPKIRNLVIDKVHNVKTPPLPAPRSCCCYHGRLCYSARKVVSALTLRGANSRTTQLTNRGELERVAEQASHSSRQHHLRLPVGPKNDLGVAASALRGHTLP